MSGQQRVLSCTGTDGSTSVHRYDVHITMPCIHVWRLCRYGVGCRYDRYVGMVWCPYRHDVFVFMVCK